MDKGCGYLLGVVDIFLVLWIIDCGAFQGVIVAFPLLALWGVGVLVGVGGLGRSESVSGGYGERLFAIRVCPSHTSSENAKRGAGRPTPLMLDADRLSSNARPTPQTESRRTHHGEPE